MTRLLPLTAIAGALACVVAIGSAQAAPVTGNVLGKLATASETTSSVEKAGYRHHHRRGIHRKWWKKRYYKSHRHSHHRHYRKHRRWH